MLNQNEMESLLADFRAFANRSCTPTLPLKDDSIEATHLCRYQEGLITCCEVPYAKLVTPQDFFNSLNHQNCAVRYTVCSIKEPMAKDGFGYTALDPTGQKSEEKMKRLFNLRAQKRYLENIKNVLTHMRRSTSGVRENTDEIVLNSSLGYLKETPSNDPSLKTDKASIARSMKDVVNAGYNVGEHTEIFKTAAEDVQAAKSSGLKGKKLSRRANRIYRNAFKASANAL